MAERSAGDELAFLRSSSVQIVAGKGGVGKTTVAAVLARAAADAGMRVLAVELDGKPGLAALVGPGVETLTITPSAALADYLDGNGFGRVVKRLASSGIIEVVARATPGIDDIVVLGKIKQLERDGAYDVIVVDGPAAGQAVTLLLSASSLLDSVRAGPVRAQATEVAAMLADPTRCQVVLVTLPETTPVNEVVETAYALEDRVGIRLGPLFVNAVDDGTALDLALTAAGSAVAAAAEFRNARRQLHADESGRLGELLALPQRRLPVVSGSSVTASDVARLAAGLVSQ